MPAPVQVCWSLTWNCPMLCTENRATVKSLSLSDSVSRLTRDPRPGSGGGCHGWGRRRGGTCATWQLIRHQPPGALTSLRSLTQPDDIYTNIFAHLHRHCGLWPHSAGVNSVRGMHKIAGSRSVCPFFNQGKERYVRVCTGMYLCILTCTGLYVAVMHAY